MDCAALGFRFAPRIRDVFDQRLFTIGRPEQDYGPFNQLLTDRVNTRLISENSSIRPAFTYSRIVAPPPAMRTSRSPAASRAWSSAV